MKVKFIGKNCLDFISKHNLENKWNKCKKLFKEDMKHPSLRVELLEPKQKRIYSFRIDRKYRALFLIKNNEGVYIFKITNHYRK